MNMKSRGIVNLSIDPCVANTIILHDVDAGINHHPLLRQILHHQSHH